MALVKHLSNKYDRCRDMFCLDLYKITMDLYFNWIQKNLRPLSARIQRACICDLLDAERDNQEERDKIKARCWEDLQNLMFDRIEK